MKTKFKLYVKNDLLFNNTVTYKDKKGVTKVLGEITDTLKGNVKLIGVNWIENRKDVFLNEIDNLCVLLDGHIKGKDIYDEFYNNQVGIMNADELSPQTLMTRVINSKYGSNDEWAFVNADLYEKYKNYYLAAEQIYALYEKNPIYENIILYKNGKSSIKTLVDVLFLLDKEKREDFITALRYTRGYEKTLSSIAERMLKALKDVERIDLLTQEEQVEAFIEYSKLTATNKHELVSDEDIKHITDSQSYKRVKNELKLKGFGLSKTQQFNVLQSVGLLHNNDKNQNNENMIYNLSDMGAGKTLMTVESIYLLDLNKANNFVNLRKYEDLKKQKNVSLWLPSKNLIAPKLSIKSSWLDTFKLFYNVTQKDENTYVLSFKSNGVTYNSLLNVSSFTAKSTTLTVDNSLPKPKTKREYLIIDEIHQLVQRKVTRSRFFYSGIVPDESYFGFILSGTLSNLTTQEWYNYIQFMGVKFNNKELDKSSARELNNSVDDLNRELRTQIKESVDDMNEKQKRVFDPNALSLPQSTIHEEKTVTGKQQVFNHLYSAKVLKINNDYEKLDLDSVFSEQKFSICYDNSIINTPNFELFYQLVGKTSITAQSTDIAEELFGEQKKQHQAEVIRTKSNLTSDDISLLKTLHDITTDYNIYKSKSIATSINNAILNLNDGLSNKNIYEILVKYANSNTRFLSYLSDLDVNVLEKLPQSGLIQQPKLEDTEKYQILKDIISKEPNESYLIVVNDANAMRKLTKALDIDSLSQKDLSNPLGYQDKLDEMFAKQNIVVVPQMMIKSSLDIIQANRLIQYQLNTEISDIIQTQNRINRIGQTRETKAFYIATDDLQKNIIDLFLETYKNIRVAHKGIVELFVDMSSQVNVVNDYIGKAMNQLTSNNNSQDNISLETDSYMSNEIEENGQLTLLGAMGIPEEEEEEEEIEEQEDFYVDPNQLGLFSLPEVAKQHQLELC